MPETPPAERRDDVRGERYRPQIHFTPERNWINDPNGLVWFEGEYHLFFQYNPQGMDWGNMCWGHAVSTDLAHWRELPVAIPETDRMIFSGSVVVDRDDVSGLGDGVAPPLVAIFTAFDAARGIQSQHLAFSHDRGRSFMHYAGNPIIDLDLADFRDPKVFYHADTAAWIMAVALSRDHVVRFYRSQNLRDWSLAGSFGPAGSTAGQWECPDLFTAPIEGETGGSAWVLKVDVDAGLTDGGSGAQYFVGAFDGRCFTVDPVRGRADGALVEQGPDFYAAITWSDLPDPQAGPIWIGWQSNHQTGRHYPTEPWRGAMSLPRRLFLYEQDGYLRLGQIPVMAGGSPVANSHGPVSLADEPILLAAPATSFEHRFAIEAEADAQIRLGIDDRNGRLLAVLMDPSAGQVTFVRHASSHGSLDGFEHATAARVRAGAPIDGHIVVDGSLVEIFLNGGRLVYSGSIFPAGAVTLSLSRTGGTAEFMDLGGRPLRRTIGTFLSDTQAP